MRLRRKLRYRRVSEGEEALILGAWEAQREAIRRAAYAVLPEGPWSQSHPVPMTAADWHRLRAVEQQDKEGDHLSELHIEPFRRWGLERAYLVYTGRFLFNSLRIVQVEKV